MIGRIFRALRVPIIVAAVIGALIGIFGKEIGLKIIAYWVVFGLPIFLLWRGYALSKIKGKPRSFYVGSVILYLGIAVWIPFALLKRILEMPISVFPFLALHLIGTSAGAMIKRSGSKQVV